MKKKAIYTLLVIGILATFFGWETHRSKSLAPTASAQVAFAEEVTGLSVIAKTYTVQESQDYLDRDLISRGYQPIQVTIQNNTAKAYFLSQDGISLPSVPAQKIARQVIKSAIPRAVAYKVASILFWPFMIPSTIDTVRTFKSYQKLKKDLVAKSVKTQEKIAPYSTFHRVLFVPMDQVQETLTVTLSEIDSENLVSFICHPQESERVVAEAVE